MSWWNIGEDVIGDRPADIFAGALGKGSQAREQGSGSKPTLRETLDAFAAALREADERRYPFNELAAIPRFGQPVAANGEGADGDLTSVLRRAVEEVEDEYRERFEREPRLSELLHTLSFVVGYKPERFFSGAREMEIDDIEAR